MIRQFVNVEIGNLVGEMIAVDHDLYTKVDRPGFQALIHHLAPRYRIPSRTHMSETVIPGIYNKLKTEVQKMVSSSPHIAITSDEWTSTCAKFAIVSLTGHLLTEEYK